MSYERMIILPLVGQFFCYTLMVLILPAILFRHKLTRFNLAARFMIYQLIGNFYLMNLVFVLQLLHICNPFTMWLTTVIFVVALMLKKKQVRFLDLMDSSMEYTRRLLTGIVGRRAARHKVGEFFAGLIKDAFAWGKRYVLPHILEWVVLVALLMFVFYLRGESFFHTYGYYASDLMVHNYWINGLTKGKLFVAGIYPFGYHCVLYSMHAMFGLKTVNLLRLFGLVEFTFIFLNLYAFLRALGKTWFAPFIGTFALSVWNFWNEEAISRFSIPLPQEYGFLFILPSLYFAILFFKERGIELKKDKEKKKEPEEGEERKKRRIFGNLLHLKKKEKKALPPVMRAPKGDNPEKVFLGVDGLYFYCTRQEYSGFLNENAGEIFPAEAFLEDGTLKPEYAVSAPKEESDYPVSVSETEDYPVHYSEGEPETAMIPSETEEDYPERFSEEDDYPVHFALEEESPVNYAEADDYPVHFSETENTALRSIAEEEDDYPVTFAEGEDDYPIYFEEREEATTLPDDWESITKEVLQPKQRELTEDEKKKYEWEKRWKKSVFWRAYEKTEPARRKIRAWIESRKYHPIRKFRAWWKTMPASSQCLLFYALAFSMTLAAHFYVTMAAGLGCIALALCYFLRFFRWKYLKSVILAVLAAFLFALYPMGFAYIGGTPLQGSIGWAMNVMKGTENDEKAGVIEVDGVSYAYSLADGMSEKDLELWIRESVANESNQEELAEMQNEGLIEGNSVDEQRESALDRIKSHLEDLKTKIRTWVTIEDGSMLGFPAEDIIFALLAVGGILGILVCLKDHLFGRAVLSMVLFCVLHLFVFIMGDFGLPRLMDENRNREFFAYAFAACVGIIADAAIFLILGWKKLRLLMQGASLAALAGTLYLLYQTDMIRWDYFAMGSLQKNGATVSTLSIIDGYPKYQWTVVTPNDEIQMIEEYGRHTETITFLRSMEEFDANSSEMYIPTDYVFFYIEKIPGNYTQEYEGSGQSISTAGAARSLPKGNRVLEVYAGEARWITMSHMYYWAQKFMELFPNEMEVLFEDDEFVCYKIQQNTYSLYNFAINYGYNAKSGSEHRRRRSEG